MPAVTFQMLKDQLSDIETRLKSTLGEMDINRVREQIGEANYQLRNAGWMIDQIQRDPALAGFTPRRLRQ